MVVQCRVRGGKQRRIVIGRCNKLALDRARVEARKIIGAAELGQDPAQERREAREVKPDTDPTFGDFADRWLDEVVAIRQKLNVEHATRAFNSLRKNPSV